MKKHYILIFFGLFFVFALTGCKSKEQKEIESKYASAVELFDSGNYKDAVVLFDDVNGYEESAEYIKKSNYNLAKALYASHSINDIDKAMEYFTSLNDYEDSKVMLDKCFEKKAHIYYEDGQFKQVIDYCNETNLEHDDDLKKMIHNSQIMLDMQGQWKNTQSDEGLVIDGKKVILYTLGKGFYTRGSYIMDTYNFSFNNSDIYTDDEYVIIHNGTLGDFYMSKENYKSTTYVVLQPTTSEELFPFAREQFLDNLIEPKPKIGMTAEEVRKTDWGNPEKINKTTTQYGVDEQWVYSNYRYVYLEDGIVTGIQE